MYITFSHLMQNLGMSYRNENMDVIDIIFVWEVTELKSIIEFCEYWVLNKIFLISLTNCQT